MSDLLPLFPLPNVVLFPNVFLPLHIFEPRYRDMVADALASDRMIGMVLLRMGGIATTKAVRLSIPSLQRRDHACRAAADGRYDIVPARPRSLPHRRRKITPQLPPRQRRAAGRSDAGVERGTARHPHLPHQLEAILSAIRASETRESRRRWPTRISSTRWRSIWISSRFEKQALLEKPGLRTRAESLVELLEMKTMMARTPGCRTCPLEQGLGIRISERELLHALAFVGLGDEQVALRIHREVVRAVETARPRRRRRTWHDRERLPPQHVDLPDGAVDDNQERLRGSIENPRPTPIRPERGLRDEASCTNVPSFRKTADGRSCESQT